MTNEMPNYDELMKTYYESPKNPQSEWIEFQGRRDDGQKFHTWSYYNAVGLRLAELTQADPDHDDPEWEAVTLDGGCYIFRSIEEAKAWTLAAVVEIGRIERIRWTWWRNKRFRMLRVKWMSGKLP